jgi:hypothetical protein
MRHPKWTLLLVFAGLAPANDPATDRPDSFSLAHRTVFFAVLEGLYEDGVATKDVERILMVDPATKTPMHFVYGCPLCSPALDALRAYAKRLDWEYKGKPNTFGHGLDEKARAALASDDFPTRFAAVQGLIKRWLGRRLKLMRLTPKEKREWVDVIGDMSKKGNALLAEFRRSGTAGELGKAKECPICSGAEAACKME